MSQFLDLGSIDIRHSSEELAIQVQTILEFNVDSLYNEDGAVNPLVTFEWLKQHWIRRASGMQLTLRISVNGETQGSRTLHALQQSINALELWSILGVVASCKNEQIWLDEDDNDENEPAHLTVCLDLDRTQDVTLPRSAPKICRLVNPADLRAPAPVSTIELQALHVNINISLPALCPVDDEEGLPWDEEAILDDFCDTMSLTQSIASADDCQEDQLLSQATIAHGQKMTDILNSSGYFHNNSDALNLETDQLSIDDILSDWAQSLSVPDDTESLDCPSPLLDAFELAECCRVGLFACFLGRRSSFHDFKYDCTASSSSICSVAPAIFSWNYRSNLACRMPLLQNVARTIHSIGKHHCESASLRAKMDLLALQSASDERSATDSHDQDSSSPETGPTTSIEALLWTRTTRDIPVPLLPRTRQSITLRTIGRTTPEFDDLMPADLSDDEASYLSHARSLPTGMLTPQSSSDASDDMLDIDGMDVCTLRAGAMGQTFVNFEDSASLLDDSSETNELEASLENGSATQLRYEDEILSDGFLEDVYT